MVSDYLRLLFPLPLASYSSCLGPFPISCSCLFVLTIFLVTYIWIKSLLLFAGWYLFSEIWEGVYWTKAKSRDAHSFYLSTFCSWFWLPCWPGMKVPSFTEFFLMWWNQEADLLAYGSSLWSSHSVVEGRGRRISIWEQHSSPCVSPTSELTSKPAQSHYLGLVRGHQCAKTQPFLDLIHQA